MTSPAPDPIQDFLDTWLTASEYGRRRGVSHVRIGKLLRYRRIAPVGRLPNGALLIRHDAAVLSPAESADPTDLPYPEGVTERAEWVERHNLSATRTRAIMAAEPHRALLWVGHGGVLVRDLPPPDFAARPKVKIDRAILGTPAFIDGSREDHIRQLRALGATYGEIGQALGISRQRAHGLAQRAGLTSDPGSAPDPARP